MHSVTDALTDLVAMAVRAPSSHNTQPWRFAFRGDAVELYADRTRALPVNDPEDRELTISCGAALFTLRVAAACHGFTPQVTALPDRGDPDLLARVQLRAGPVGEVDLAPMGAAVGRRRTHRAAFGREPVPREVLDRMVDAAIVEGAQLQLLDGDSRERIAALVDLGDRAQFEDRRWRRELASWMHPRRSGDGLTVPLLALPATRLVVSTIDLGPRTGAKDADLARAAPALGVLTTAGDTPSDWMRAGQALQRLLLIAAADGVAAGYLNQPCQVGGELRQRVAREIDDAAPQVILRLGRPPRPLVPTPRRPVAEVLDR